MVSLRVTQSVRGRPLYADQGQRRLALRWLLVLAILSPFREAIVKPVENALSSSRVRG